MLTSTKQSIKGYWIENLKKNVYSIEEINYFIYNHINLVYRDFFSDALFEYIDTELKQPAMAADLRKIASNNGSTGDFVKYILNESYYYNSGELAQIAHLVAHIDDMGRAERIKIQGDSYFSAGKFNSALECYQNILNNMESEDASEMFYADVAYSAGLVYAKFFMTKSANAYFSMAYDLSPNPKYAKACIYMSIISGDDEELLAAIVRYKISDDMLDSIRRRIEATKREIEGNEDSAQFSRELRESGAADHLVRNWKKNYYNMLK